VSAASVPKPAEPAEPSSDADGWALLEAMRRRLDEQVTQGRKTQAQVGQLADSIAALVAQQRRRSLWLNVNSFVAYVVFTILCGAGCYLLYRSRANELASARDQAIGERDAAVRRSDEATVRAVAREAAATKAWEVYELLEAGKRGDAVAKLEALRDQPLSKTERAVLAARVHETQVMEVDAALKAAAAALKAGRPADVIRPLEAALSAEPPGMRAATLHYYLGIAYAKTELDKAIAHLQAAIAGDVDQDDARFQLASVLDRRGSYGLARTEYDRYATAHPQSPLAMFAMRRSATLTRWPASAPPAAPAAAPPAGGVPPAAAAPPPPSSWIPPASATAPPGVRPVVPAAPPGPALPAARPGASALAAPGQRPPAMTKPWGKPVVKPVVPLKPPSLAGDPGDPTAGPKPEPSEPAKPVEPGPGVTPAP